MSELYAESKERTSTTVHPCLREAYISPWFFAPVSAVALGRTSLRLGGADSAVVRKFLKNVRIIVIPLLIQVTASCQAVARANTQGSIDIRVHVIDFSTQSIPAALVTLTTPKGLVSSETCDQQGDVSFTGLERDNYFLTVGKSGFQSIEEQMVALSPTNETILTVTLPPRIIHKENVEVNAQSDKIAETSAPDTLQTSAARELPARPSTLREILPLIPGVVRSQEGGLQISGSGEHRSALIVNSADVTDPGTGQFGSTVPIDIIESLTVYQTPFLAEYGRFSAGLVAVETRRAGDQWKWDINDPFPDFRIRSYDLQGIRDATPRLNLEGPLLARKLYFTEGFEYDVRKTSVFTLPYPENQQTEQGFNSFSQFDYVLSSTQLITGTFHVAPQRYKSVNMNFFNPQPTAPDASLHDETATISDKRTFKPSDLFDNTLSYTRYTAGTWPHGPQGLVITPVGNYGNYFAQQERTSSRESWSSTYTIHRIDSLGEHSLKFGTYIAPSSDRAQIAEKPITILDTLGRPLERISFSAGLPVEDRDTEFALFGQDHWLLTSHLAMDIGLRAESQEETESLRLAPRAGFAWTPFANTGTIIRGGAGLFYDRVPLNVFGFSQYPNQVITNYGPMGQILQGPVTYWNMLGTVEAKTPFVFHKNTAGNFSPRSRSWSLQIEQSLTSFVKLRASYVQNESAGLVILNPVSPVAAGSTGTMLLSGNGLSRYRQFELTTRLRLPSEKEQLFVSYVRSRDRGDLNDFSTYLGNFPAPVIRQNQFGSLPADLPNRLLTWGLIHLPCQMQIAPILEYRSGSPYAVTDVVQAYVGSPYSQRFPDFLSFDARLSKDFKVNGKYTVRFSVTGNNITRHWNPDSVFSNTGAPEYGLFFGQHGRRFMADFDVFF